MSEPLRVGIIGANPKAGWARFSHIPALQSLTQFRLAAVATTNQASADAAAQAFGAERAFASAQALADSDDVDIVAVSVKAPMHHDVAMAAIKAGKHVFCEWPMGANLEQSAALAAAAQAAGVRSFVGLQARVAPAIVHAKRLIEEGYLGRVYSASMWGAFSYWGSPVSTAYSADVTTGANVLSIPGGHGLDAMCLVLGDEIAELSGRETHLRTVERAADIGAEVAITAPDQFAAVGTLRSGAVFSAHIAGVAPRGEQWRVQLVGDRGELVIEGDGMPEIAPLRLSGTTDRAQPVSPIEPPAGPASPPGPAGNVSLLWAAIAQDLREGVQRVADFGHGAMRRDTLDAITRSHDASGARVTF